MARGHGHAVAQLRCFAGRGQQVGQVGLVQHTHRRAMRQGIGQAWLLFADAQGHADGTQLRRGKQGHDKLNAVAQQQGHAVARTHAVFAQGPSQGLAGVLQLAIGHALLVAHQGHAIGVALYRLGQQGMQAVPTLGKTSHHAVAMVRLLAHGGPGVIPLTHRCLL